MRNLRARILIGVAALALPAAAAIAEVKTRTIEYEHDEAALRGCLAYDDSFKGSRPGVLVIHGRRGLDDHARKRARQLARLGYVAFAADMYGGGQTGNAAVAARPAGRLKKGRSLMRARARAGLDVLRKHPRVNEKKLAAVGFGPGGTACLELARSGADLAAVVSFHGALDTPEAADARKIKAKVLVLHAAGDPSVPAGQVAAFQKEMTDAGVDWQMVTYGGAARKERAARRAWQAMKLFFAQTIGLPRPEGDGGGIGGFAKDKIAKPVGKAGKAVGQAGKVAGKAVGHAAKWTWRKITD